MASAHSVEDPDQLVTSCNPDHPANLIPSLCAKFWTLGWVTGTGGGCSIREEYVETPRFPHHDQKGQLREDEYELITS